MMQAAIAAIALTSVPDAGNHANATSWARVAEEDASLAVIPFGFSHLGSKAHWRGDRRYVLNLGQFERNIGEVFARGSSASFDIFKHVARHNDPIPQQVKLVRELRQLSGLTWQSLADMIGVSAKTLHNWAAGKPIDEKKLKRAGEIIAVLQYVDRGNADANRALLLNQPLDGLSVYDLIKAGDFAQVRELIGRGQGRASAAPSLPSSVIAAWGPEHFGEQFSKWQFESDTEFEPSARPTRARPANARRKG